MRVDLRHPDDKLFYRMAKELVYDRALWDDVVQEARIHDWRIRTTRPGMSDRWYHKCARRKISEVSRRQTWTGYVSHRGHPIDPLRRPHESLDQLNGWARDDDEHPRKRELDTYTELG